MSHIQKMAEPRLHLVQQTGSHLLSTVALCYTTYYIGQSYKTSITKSMEYLLWNSFTFWQDLSPFYVIKTLMSCKGILIPYLCLLG